MLAFYTWNESVGPIYTSIQPIYVVFYEIVKQDIIPPKFSLSFGTWKNKTKQNKTKNEEKKISKRDMMKNELKSSFYAFINML